ncbi:MAG: mercuric transporter MerT family protein [Myxococcota bacterium]
MKRETLATGGVLGLSVVIASCCVAPALFLLFGVSVGALGSLSIFEPVRPYLIVLGGGLLLYAGVRIFRAAPATAGSECAQDACAPDAPSRRLTRWLFWMASAVYVIAVAYPMLLGALL